MRRIEQYTRAPIYEDGCAIISKRDLRLLLRVARQADLYRRRGFGLIRLCELVDALNAKPRKGGWQ